MDEAESGKDATIAATAAGVEGLKGFEIKEYSDGSESTTTEDNLSVHRSRCASETPTGGALDATAEGKGNTRNQTPGAKRGGTRFSGNRAMLSWSRLIGTGKRRHAVGDLVEAEWRGSGSWYVGYVEGDAASVEGSSRKSKDMYHVVFADGDEADVHGRDLKQLGPTGHAKGSAGTLPRHVPVADLGSGRLYQKPTTSHVSSEENAEPKRGKRRGKSVVRRKGEVSASQREEEPGSTQSLSETDMGAGYDDQYGKLPTTEGEGRELPPPLRRGSAGNVDNRCHQAEQALWGGRRVPPSKNQADNSKRPVYKPATGDGGGWRDGGGDWWETGSQYAFQPRLETNKPTVRSLVGHGGGGAGHQVRRGGGDGGNGEFERKMPSRRVIQPAVGNSDRGQRVFFLA